MPQKDVMPLVSIGMPVYNGEGYVKNAIKSLLNQTFKNFELIISDNASTDETKKICQQYARQDIRIKYTRQPQTIDVLKNFEFVSQKARGKYFMWAAHDDDWADTFLKKAVSYLEADKTCGLVFSNFATKNLKTGLETNYKPIPSMSSSKVKNYLIRILSMHSSMIYGLYRYETIKDMALERFDFSDVHFILRTALKSRIQVIDEYLYTAGEKGTRKPYSLVHRKINRTVFIHQQFSLLRKNFCLPIAMLLGLILSGIMLHNKIILWRY